jgi:PAS domain S-box-containing protein
LAGIQNGHEVAPSEPAPSDSRTAPVNHARYRAIVEEQTELICRFLPDTSLTFVNEAYCRYFGRTRAELLGHRILELLPEAARAEFQAHLAGITRDHSVADHENAVLRPDGSLGWQHWINRATFTESGAVIEFQAVGRDITERKRIEDALRASERRFREVLDNSRDLVYRVRLSDLAFEYVSPSAREISGFTPDEVVAMGLRAIFERVHPDDRQHIPRIEDRGAGPVIKDWGVPRSEFRFLHSDGKYRWLHAVRATVQDEHGTPVAGIGIIRDVTEQHRISEELRLHRECLAELVAQRTAELAQANARLQQELAERQRAEQELRESEERYRLLADSMADFVILSDHTGRRLYVSPSFYRATGYTADDIGDSDFRLRVHPDDRALIENTRQANLRGEATQVEYRCACKDGTHLWLEIRATPICGPDGSVEKILCCARDIQGRKGAEKLLVIQRDLGLALLPTTTLADALDALLDATLRIDGIDCGGVYLVDETRRELRLVAYRNLSQRFVERVARVPADSPLGHLAVCGQIQYWPRPEIPIEPEFLDREGLQAGACLPVQFNGRVIGTLNLGSHTLSDIPVAVRHTLETIAARVGSVLDRIQAKDALAESEARFRVLCNAAPVGIFLARPGGTNLYANPWLQTLCGLSPEQTLEFHWLSAVHPADRPVVRQWLEEARRRGVDFRHEFRLLQPDQRQRWVHVHTVGFGPPGQDQLRVGIVQDLTEHRAAEEAARQHREQLAHVARISTLGEMAAGIAHELAQPLSAIRYFASGCQKQLKHGRWGAAEAATAIRKIAAQAERASEFILRVKAFARRTPPQRVPSDLNTIVRGALDFVMPQAHSGGLAVELDLDETIAKVLVDPIQIEQAILNLVWNSMEALEAVPPDERRLHIRTCAGAGRTVCFEVHDTGPGLPADVRDHLFDPFFTSKPNGTGLGLPISRTLIEEMHAGHLWVQPDPERGARAGFTVPAAPE